MKTSRWIILVITLLVTAGLAGCGSDKTAMEKLVTGPKT